MSQRLILNGERSGLLTRIAATEPVSPFDPKSDRPLANYDEQLWLAPFKVLAKSLKGIDT